METDVAVHGAAQKGVRRLRLHWPLVLILAYTSAIGLWQLPARGTVFVDEGYQVLEARWVEGKVAYLAHHFPRSFDEKTYVLDDGDGLPPQYGKPLHALLEALAVGIFPWRDPTSVLLLQGIFGLGVIALAYGIAWRLGGRVAAVASGTLLAVSAGFLAYRRSALPEMDSIFFFALAVWLLVRWSDVDALRGWRPVAVGVSTGLCFTANDRWYVALPIVVVMAWALRGEVSWRGLRQMIGHAASITAGFLMPILVFEAVSTSFLWMGHDRGIRVPYPTYFQQLHARYRLVTITHHGTPALEQIRHSPYLGYLAAFDGWVWVIVAVVGSATLMIRRARWIAVPLLWSLGPLLLVSASKLVAPRYLSLAIPGICLSLGLATAAFVRSGRTPRFFAMGALGAALVSSIWQAPQIFRVRAEWDAPLARVRAEGGGRILSPKSYPLASYVGKEGVVLGWQDSLAWAREQRAAGARWLLLEIWTPPGSDPATSRDAATVLGPLGELSHAFVGRRAPVFSQRFPPHDFVYEGFPDRRDRVILLYDLRALDDVFGSGSPPASGPSPS